MLPINWFALGFSDRGDLENADVCLVWTDYKEQDHFEVSITRVQKSICKEDYWLYNIFQDMHSDSKGKLTRDLKQNCDSFYVDAKSRSITFERFFDTCDDDDYIIEVYEIILFIFKNSIYN